MNIKRVFQIGLSVIGIVSAGLMFKKRLINLKDQMVEMKDNKKDKHNVKEEVEQARATGINAADGTVPKTTTD